MKKHSFAIKVCGITRQSDLSTAMGMGAHFCGFIFHPKSPRYIAPSRAAALDSALIRRVGVFVNQNAEEIMDVMKTARLEFAQLHGAQSLDCARRYLLDPKTGNPLPTYERRRYRGGFGYALPVFVYLE